MRKSQYGVAPRNAYPPVPLASRRRITFAWSLTKRVVQLKEKPEILVPVQVKTKHPGFFRDDT
jgi:hypothetical protein